MSIISPTKEKRAFKFRWYSRQKNAQNNWTKINIAVLDINGGTWYNVTKISVYQSE